MLDPSTHASYTNGRLGRHRGHQATHSPACWAASLMQHCRHTATQPCMNPTVTRCEKDATDCQSELTQQGVRQMRTFVHLEKCQIPLTLSALALAFFPLFLAALSCFSNFSYTLLACSAQAGG
jgi:hypothetical protein